MSDLIGPLVNALRDRVAVPQGDPVVTPEEARRAWYDPEREAPLGAELRQLTVLPLRSVPIAAEIGAGMGLAGGTVTVSHELAVVLWCDGMTREDADAERNPIVGDLLARAIAVDWVNLPELAGTGLEVTKCAWSVDYSDLGVSENRAYATLAFTVETEWTP